MWLANNRAIANIWNEYNAVWRVADVYGQRGCRGIAIGIGELIGEHIGNTARSVNIAHIAIAAVRAERERAILSGNITTNGGKVA